MYGNSIASRQKLMHIVDDVILTSTQDLLGVGFKLASIATIGRIAKFLRKPAY